LYFPSQVNASFFADNIVAEELEKLGVRTFSTQEMAFNILGLMHPSIAQLSQSEPIWADLNGGLQLVSDLNSVLKYTSFEFASQGPCSPPVSSFLSFQEHSLFHHGDVPDSQGHCH